MTCKKIGGIFFVKFGRYNVSFCKSKAKAQPLQVGWGVYAVAGWLSFAVALACID